MLLKQQIGEILNYQRSFYNNLPSGTLREKLNHIDLSSDHIKIITGIRRCGKSTMMLQLARQKGYVNFLSFEDPRLSQFEIEDFFKLEELFQKDRQSEIYFFDEIQNVKGWEKFVRLLHDKKIKMFISGSNASLLSKELGTSLTGRQITYELFPFSFREFLAQTSQTAGIKAFDEYLMMGGFPEYLKTNNRDVLIQLFNDLIYRDIVVRHGLRNAKVVRELAVFLATNTGKKFSYSKLAYHFELGSVNTVRSYISYFEDSYLFFTIPRFSYSLKQQAKNPKKVYGIDTGLIRQLSLSFTDDFGRILENAVFIVLRSAGKDIYYYKNKWECDFVVSNNSHVEQVIQVCYILDNDNLKREVNGLLEAMNSLKLSSGIILTHKQTDRMQKEGKTIYIKPVWQWMLENTNV